MVSDRYSGFTVPGSKWLMDGCQNPDRERSTNSCTVGANTVYKNPVYGCLFLQPPTVALVTSKEMKRSLDPSYIGGRYWRSNPLNAEDSSLGTPGVSSSSLVPQSSLSMESTDQRERPKNLGTWKPEISATPKSVSGRAYQLPRSTGMHRSDSEDKIRSTSKEANPITKVPRDSIASAKIIKSALMEAHTKLSANIIKNTLKDASSVAGADIIRSSLKDSGSITGPMDFSSKTLAQKDPLCIINTPKNATRTKCAPKDATGFSPQKSKEQAATAMDPSEKQRAQAGIRPSLLETLKHQLSTLGEDSDSDEQQDHP
ncbi:hypothetical protein NDU88_008295 [Pleurodeles waltl]|uniref:Uncharacterized protein n=1 Tax=Pleurodeles waltl TaxID=8319 RepID=A0AAV7U2V4_PLEWA|nr:hypothetical protein NDU88_008295 [Pleurodeles waltl]